MSVVDTNLLVHSTTPASSQHTRARVAIAQLTASGTPAVSRQILREYLAVMTRPQPWAEAMPLTDAISGALAFATAFRVLDDGPHVWAELAQLARTFQFGGKQVHDANIVATMLAHGENRLLTFNTAHFRRFSSLIEINEP